MSDWELDFEPSSTGASQPVGATQPESEWQLDFGTDEYHPQKESYLTSLVQAPYRIRSDLGTALSSAVQNAKNALHKAPSEFKGIVPTMFQHPLHMAGQQLAGAGELLGKITGMPEAMANYVKNRLNLGIRFPEEMKAISEHEKPISSVALHKFNELLQSGVNKLGEPKYPGEALARGTIRNLDLISGGVGLTKAAAKGTKKGVNALRESFKQPEKIPESPVFDPYVGPEMPQMPEQQIPVPKAPEAGSQLLQSLGKGAANTDEASTKLADMIRESHAGRAEESRTFFQHVFDQAGHEKLYEKPDPLISTKLDKEKAILKRLSGLNVQPLLDKFKSSPTIANAHWLKSELGTAIGDLESSLTKTPADRATIANLKNVRSTLESDIIDALERVDKRNGTNYAKQYKTGVQLHAENVAPFRSTKGLREIVLGGVKTPRNIEKLFDTPTDIVGKEGQIAAGNIKRVVEALPPDARDLILFNKIGGNKFAGNHKGLINALRAAQNEGYGHYFSPKTEAALSNLERIHRADIEAAEKASQLHKKMIAEKKAAHKKQAAEMKYEYQKAKQNALLRHKQEVNAIKKRNEALKKLKKKRNRLAGLAALEGARRMGVNYIDRRTEWKKQE